MANSSKKLDFLVVIPVKNEEEYIRQCMDSVLSQVCPGRTYKVVVIDNGSTDNTKNILIEYKDRVTILTKKHGTIASLRNYGACYEPADKIAFLDGDCVVPETWLKTGATILENDKCVSCVGFAATVPHKNTSLTARVWHEMSSGSKYLGTQTVEWLSSFNMIVKSETFKKVNGFDEDLVTCEDYDLGIRLSNISKLIYSDSISIQHLGTVKGPISFFIKEYWRGLNNLNTLFKGNKGLTSIASVVIPCLQVVFTCLLMLNLIVDLAHFMVLVLAFLFFPFIMALRKLKRNNLHYCVHFILLSILYLNARGLAVFKSCLKLK